MKYKFKKIKIKKYDVDMACGIKLKLLSKILLLQFLDRLGPLI